MDTPGERIRKAAEEAEQKKAQQDARNREIEAQRAKDLQEREARANAMGQKFLAAASEMRAQSRRCIYLFLESHDANTRDPGFSLAIGKPRHTFRGIRASVGTDGRWHVSSTGNRGARIRPSYHEDADLEHVKGGLVEALMTEAAVALGAGEEDPSEER